MVPTTPTTAPAIPLSPTPSTDPPFCAMTSECAPIVDGEYDFSSHTRPTSPAANVSITPQGMPNKNPTTTALYTSRTRNTETWHRRLGHCNFGTFIDMAQRGAVEGAAIDLSSSPPKCNACILGKQTRSPVPKVREGGKASCPFERVFVDLCGSIHPVPTSGHLYSVNVIGDFSKLQKWHCAVENQSEHRFEISGHC